MGADGNNYLDSAQMYETQPSVLYHIVDIYKCGFFCYWNLKNIVGFIAGNRFFKIKNGLIAPDHDGPFKSKHIFSVWQKVDYQKPPWEPSWKHHSSVGNFHLKNHFVWYTQATTRFHKLPTTWLQPISLVHVDLVKMHLLKFKANISMGKENEFKWLQPQSRSFSTNCRDFHDITTISKVSRELSWEGKKTYSERQGKPHWCQRWEGNSQTGLRWQ